MKKLAFLLALMYSTTQTSMRCNTNMVSSYGFNPESLAVYQPMLFCANVQFKCCSYFDELKHQKLWKSYYQEKLDKSYEVLTQLGEGLQKVLDWAHSIDESKYKAFTTGACSISDIKASITKAGFNSMEPLKSSMPAIKEIDVKIKEQFICFICDAKNHLSISDLDKHILIDEKFCSNLLSVGKNYISSNVKLYQVIIAINDLFSCLNISNSRIVLNNTEIDEMRHFVLHSHDCLYGSYSKAKCANLCGNYSIQDVSKNIVGNIELYRQLISSYEFVDSFIKQTEAFEKSLETAKKPTQEKPKKDGESKDNAKEGDKKKDENGDKEKKEGEEKKDEKKEDEAEKKRRRKRMLKNKRLLSEDGDNEIMNDKLAEIADNVSHYKIMMRQMKNKNKNLLRKIYNVNRGYDKRWRQLNNNAPHNGTRYLQLTGGMIQTMPQTIGLPVYQQMPPTYQPPVVPQQPIQQQTEPHVNTTPIVDQQALLLQQQQYQQQLMQQNQQLQQSQVTQPSQQYQQLVQSIQNQAIHTPAEPTKEELNEKVINEVKKKTIIETYVTLYDQLIKGTPDDFKDFGWITNKFFDGSYLDNYKLAFGPGGVSLEYKMTEYYTKPKEIAIEKMIEKEAQGPKKIKIENPANSTVLINSMVDLFDLKTIYEFKFDTDIWIGGAVTGADSAEDKCMALKLIKEEARKKKKDDTKTADTVKEEEKKEEKKKEERLLRKMRKIQNQLKGIGKHHKRSKKYVDRRKSVVKKSRKLIV